MLRIAPARLIHTWKKASLEERSASLQITPRFDNMAAKKISSASGARKKSRLPVAKPGAAGGFVESTSRALYTSRTRRGPLLAPSEKADRLLPCESVLEGTFVAATRFDTRVERIHPQPLVMDVVTGITAPDRNQLMERLASQGYAAADATLWFVDFELAIVGRIRPVYVEVKPEMRAGKVAARLEARAKACTRIGVDFMLVLDSDFARPLVDNLHILQRYAGMPLCESTKTRVLESVQRGPMRLEDLVTVSGAGLAEVYGLVSTGHLGLDLRAEVLSPRATVHASNPGYRALLKLPE